MTEISLTSGGRENKGPGSAEKILEAARIEFAEFGPAGARIDRIAMRAGINKAMIYYHFHSKDNLYQRIIRIQTDMIAEHISKLIDKKIDAEKFLYEVAEFYHGMFEKVAYFRPIFLHELASGGERIKEAFGESIGQKGISGKLYVMIDDYIRAGQFRRVDIRQAITSFITMNIGYFLIAPVINKVWEIDDEKKFRNDRPEALVDLFLHGIKTR
nr:TetR/AcrR family transcriptional regulator [candidate division Zixibacteria bacterium]